MTVEKEAKEMKNFSEHVLKHVKESNQKNL